METPAYAAATIPGGMYPNNAEDIASWGPKATIVTSTAVSDEVAYEVVKAIFENFDAFKKLHPAFARLDEKEMVTDSLSAEIHPGALKYYQERGWK
jgi:TRAP transporter TAXI family solute receptor